MRALSGATSALESAAVIIALSKCWNFQHSVGAMQHWCACYGTCRVLKYLALLWC